ncbi:hypothetical protein CCACVL1_23968 [Corchorus capsularis]|uniref:PLAC8 motif-containing protein n=1 Tax=Corchorus capsularis TaxID=210143 RepID=A0A1R3GRI8_COCAP|nr:hypothetical protein CCACVL1_23968 [Corchorus capsularis]
MAEIPPPNSINIHQPAEGIDTQQQQPGAGAIINTQQLENEPQAVSSTQQLEPQAIPWSTGLCDCFSDCFLCCKTCICPCVTFGQNAEIIDQGSSACAVDAVIYVVIHHFSCCFISFMYACYYRRKFRLQYGLKASPCPDFCAHSFCHYCALCQEHRELKNLGYLMTIGWNANVERRAQQGVTLMAPVVETGMHR